MIWHIPQGELKFVEITERKKIQTFLPEKDFTDHKTKSILFATKFKIKKVRKLNIEYGDIQIKQHSKIKYSGCVLGEIMSGETIAFSVTNKINNKLKFIYRKNRKPTITKTANLWLF